MDPLAGPLLCDPGRKAELEARNGDDQLEYITDLVERGARELRESHVLTLQEIAIREIYPCGGRYRNATKDVFIQNSKHRLPEVAFVPSLVRDSVDWINRETGRSALERASYALWRLNWIHPFAGGNGLSRNRTGDLRKYPGTQWSRSRLKAIATRNLEVTWRAACPLAKTRL